MSGLLKNSKAVGDLVVEEGLDRREAVPTILRLVGDVGVAWEPAGDVIGVPPEFWRAVRRAEAIPARLAEAIVGIKYVGSREESGDAITRSAKRKRSANMMPVLAK